MKNLDLSPQALQKLLDDSTAIVLDHFENIHEQKGYNDFPQETVESWFQEPLPEAGMSAEALLDLFVEKVLKTATGNAGPHMYAYVMAGGNQIGIVADKLAATINQNAAKWHLGPAITEIDKRVIQWAAEMIGFGENVGGFIGSSGSTANLDGLTVARNVYFEKLDIRNKGLFGSKPFIVYCSEETHSSVDKSVQLLGIGLDYLRKVPTNADFTIDLDTLEKQIVVDKQNGLQPFCIVGNAGTVNTGAVDDLSGVADIAEKHHLWFHVDGAYGGLVSSLESKRDLYRGLDRADSVALDFHKWLYQPFEVGCLLVKSWADLRTSYFKKAAYLDTSLEQGNNRHDFNEHHFMLSRNGKALKVWMSIKYYGIRRIKGMIQKDIDLTDYLNEQINAAPDFRLIADSPLAISCFQYVGGLSNSEDIIALNRQLIPALEKDGRVFITGTTLKGQFVLRACLINHRKTEETTDYLLDVIRDVAEKQMSK